MENGFDLESMDPIEIIIKWSCGPEQMYIFVWMNYYLGFQSKKEKKKTFDNIVGKYSI